MKYTIFGGVLLIAGLSVTVMTLRGMNTAVEVGVAETRPPVRHVDPNAMVGHRVYGGNKPFVPDAEAIAHVGQPPSNDTAGVVIVGGLVVQLREIHFCYGPGCTSAAVVHITSGDNEIKPLVRQIGTSMAEVVFAERDRSMIHDTLSGAGVASVEPANPEAFMSLLEEHYSGDAAASQELTIRLLECILKATN